MFKFDFSIDDIDEEIQDTIPTTSATKLEEETSYTQAPFQEHSISELLDALPSLISYSSIVIAAEKGKQTITTLLHRDLFDARFQLISEGKVDSEGISTELDTIREEDEDEEEKEPRDRTDVLVYLDTPSDLLPGVYEGGLKTWECSLDVVEYLATSRVFPSYQGKRVVELGCGTAVPSLYVLQRLFSDPGDSVKRSTEIHLQDYNDSVLELITLPNVLLTWCASSESRRILPDGCSSSHLDTSPASQSFLTESQSEGIDPSSPGELSVTKELKQAFLASLNARQISIRFFSGSWETFDLTRTGGNYDLLITSETIYRKDSLVALTKILDEGSAPADSLATKAMKNLSLKNDDERGIEEEALCLVAAKILYFGVGGGISEFVDFVTETKSGRKGDVRTVLEKLAGVGRRVLSIKWIN
ncbi:hypothetical protein BKA70DRAFT_667593 [Coprinopsis sp. MPI-PUGE-AT-0042]|nr:hypothetical protein BKA70DRAFT_667593 [Coprinopsis sp. MPI-PUGE-AT-0042]